MISLNDIVVSNSIRIGGNKIDEMIATYVRRKYNLQIGERTAEDIKMAIGSALPLERELEVEIRGRDTIDGLPKTRVMTSGELTEAVSEALTQIVTAVKMVLEQTPPELAADVADKGMILTGGGALLRNLDRLLAKETGVPGLRRRRPAELRRHRRRARPRALRDLQGLAHARLSPELCYVRPDPETCYDYHPATPTWQSAHARACSFWAASWRLARW